VEREHAREREPDADVDERPRQLDQLAELRVERDRLRVIVDSYPADTAREILRLEAHAASERQLAGKDAWRAGHWQSQYEELGLLGRRGQEGRQARERADRFAAQADEQHQRADRLETQARTLTEGPDGPRGWERAHPGARERLYEAETQLAAAVKRSAGERSGPVLGVAEGFDRGAARRELGWLRSERDRFREELRSYPSHQARDAEQADRRAAQADRDVQAARARAGEAERERQEMGRLARRGQRGTQAQERQHISEDQADHHQQYADAQRQAAQEARERPGGPAAWERAHPGVRDRLDIYEHALEVATEQQARRAVQIAVGRDPAVRVLGPRPAHPDNRKVWDRGAEAISAYRLAHDITSQDTVLGPEPDRRELEQHADLEQAAKLAL